MVKRVNLLIVSTLVLAACGGGNDDGGSAANSEGWCDLAQRIEDSDGFFDGLVGDDPAALEAALGDLQGLLDEAAQGAPDAILADVNTTADGVDAFAKLLDDADYDVANLDDAALAELDEMSAEMDAAGERVEAYNETECGISPDDDDDDVAVDQPADDPPDEAAPEDEDQFSGAADSAWCVAARDVEMASDVLDGENFDFTDPAAVETAFADMLAAFEPAIASAPPEIAADVDTTYEGFLQLRDALAAVEYDFLRADLAVLDELDSEMDAASARIEAYNEDVCGIPADDTVDEPDEPDDSGEFDPTAGSIRDQTVAELVAQGFTQDEAECIFDGIDFTDPDLGADMNVIIEVFDSCGIDLARLAELGG